MKDLTQFPDYTLILVDGMNYAFRSYYGLKELEWQGKPTGMLYGIARYVFGLQKLYPQARIIFLWEGAQLRRKAMCVEYKSSRNKKDSTLLQCLYDVQKFLEYAGVDQMRHLGLEADDMAGYLISKSTENDKILLVTMDEDWFQFMLPGRVSIQRGTMVETFDELKESLEFPPNRMYMLKVLKGGHDDLPGVPGLPLKVVKVLAQNCDSYKDIRTYPLHKSKPEWVRWEIAILDNWDVIEQNALLSMFHPEWINESQIVCVTGKRDNAELVKLLEMNGIRKFNVELT